MFFMYIFHSKKIPESAVKKGIKFVVENDVEDVREHVHELDRICCHRAEDARNTSELSQFTEVKEDEDAGELRQSTEDVDEDADDDHDVGFALDRYCL